ncbi:MAG: nicotinamide-nucleotide amidohydrolase family protein [Clostridiales bacterium]|nr:nicotinamide-nucleotide amidohydrolase family protein [Clostridiales bacterium]
MEIKTLIDNLRNKKLRVAVAESFTGGGVASEFVSVSGASDVFAVGLVCYAENAKERILGVKRETLDAFGAVSEQTISEMLDGLKALGLGQVMLATSGNAGPTSEKADEVGVFYLGVMCGEEKIVRRYKASGSRAEVIRIGIQEGLDLIAEIISK